MKLDHIGIAVDSINEARKFYETLGFKMNALEEVSSEKVKIGFFKISQDSEIELLEALDETSPIAKFIAKRGPGIHHLCFEVEDIRSVIEDLKKKGFQMINDQPKIGAKNSQIAFVHPNSTGGVLIEINQKKAALK